ncbi:hypothetical protein ETB97_009790 [Aspergillus alliaceus]|uniref:Uncharacterized protein n=1 Tax=Petromyces alliaceus TaxID=209559 RepID=A0A8H6A831_PETAA|nr:hypothetical protein ETB97_009790 [Aspergillus burnettii]
MSLGTWLRVFRLSSANQLQSLFKTENPLLPVLVEYGNRWKVKNDRRGFIGEDGEFKSGTAIPNVDMSNDTTKNFLPLVTLWYNARIEPLTGRWVRMGGILIGVKLKLDIEDTGTDPAEHRRVPTSWPESGEHDGEREPRLMRATIPPCQMITIELENCREVHDEHSRQSKNLLVAIKRYKSEERKDCVKLQCLLRIMDKEHFFEKPYRWMLIFAMWSLELWIIEIFLDQLGLPYIIIRSDMNNDHCGRAAETFNKQPPSATQILLCTYGCGATGLNLYQNYWIEEAQ